MANVQFNGIHKMYGSESALNDFNLDVLPGELVSILGPSGCGKTTALRILAGFVEPTKGKVSVAGDDVTSIPAQDRGFGMVFQSYSLFPNMTALENIDFALKLRKVSAKFLASKSRELLELTQMSEHANKYPNQLSGGQQQRVALARALAIEPSVLLLDEPLSALDASVREQLRDEIRNLQRRLGITTLFVTHDQQEALAISDRVAVMRSGRVEQVGTPQDLYLNPTNSFVAQFVGTTNRIPAQPLGEGIWAVLDSKLQGPISSAQGTAYIRPESLDLTLSNEGSGTIMAMAFLGYFVRVSVNVPHGSLSVDMPVSKATSFQVGDKVSVLLEDTHALIEVGKL
jgi:putative spermidine/putrescine transport system ATP-binding protein